MAKSTLSLALVTLSAFLILKATLVSPFGLDVLDSDELVTETNTAGKCRLEVDVDVSEDVVIAACNYLSVRIVLENEYRARCEDYGKKCKSLHEGYKENGKMFSRCCLPIPNQDKTFTIVKHSNYVINEQSCSATVDFKYINATNCGCLLL